MAHVDIEVSQEWRLSILQELTIPDLFIQILSATPYDSIWCNKESEIAAYRSVTFVPLSTDGSLPQVFIAYIQSTKIDSNAPKFTDLLSGLAKRDMKFVIDALISLIDTFKSFRGAEANFELILPYIDKAVKEHIVELLNVSTVNKQICHAGLCATKSLPPFFATHGKFMKIETCKDLADVLKQYENVVQ
ncbi:MAG TPA: hypothetical protein VLN61_09090 [Pseudolabrys sp.]|nr:hypothetical protein [Pseudolabrys sp.]